MTGVERHSRVTAQFFMPAVLEDYKPGKDWKYSSINWLITNTANPFLVQYVLATNRS
jgi:hypothetical protein